MPDRVEVEGVDRLAATLAAAGDQVGDLSATNARVADYWAGRAAAGAPRVSGRLAGSVVGEGTAAGPVVRANAPYAGPIHYGWAARNISPSPFITAARDSSMTTIERMYGDELDRVASTVKGK